MKKTHIHTDPFCDLYHLTMAQAYFHGNHHNLDANFYMSFRQAPFKSGYILFCGHENAFNVFQSPPIFSNEFISKLADLVTPNGDHHFQPNFLDYLRKMRWSVDIDAAPEATVVFPIEPVLRAEGNIIECMILESHLLHILNFQSLVATKSARIVQAACGDPVLEFGLRRAQGGEGAIGATRAAFIGGCTSTSNVHAAIELGIPASGTVAHSWTMTFDDEADSFAQFGNAAQGKPCTLLIDTYSTTQGIKNAINVARRETINLAAVRIDSGDLCYLSNYVRDTLDAADMSYTKVIASNNLDESLINSLKQQGAKIDIWGVGTKLITAYDQPAIGGVYKLSAISREGKWTPRMKVSDQLIKTSIPGRIATKRYYVDSQMVYDVVYDIDIGISSGKMIDPKNPLRRRQLAEEDNGHSADLLVSYISQGRRVRHSAPLRQLQSCAKSSLAGVHGTVRRVVNPHTYPVGLEEELYKQRENIAMSRTEGTN